MTDLRKLIDAYNAGLKQPQLWGGVPICKPRAKSIRKINESLSVQIPESMIEFVAKSKRNDWLASLGDDYDSPFHILKINRYCRSIRRRVIKGKGQWEYVFPKHFVAITLGHDEDYICLDLSKYNPSTGEYAIQYWAPPRIFGDKVYPDFPAYMTSCLKFWNKL